MESEKREKIRVLFRGWLQIPHSYSLVNCFQLVHLFKNYSDRIEFYVEEMPYFRQEWNNSKKLVYNESYNDIIKNFKKWNGEKVDLIYSITYPYNMTMEYDKINGEVIPKCVFYTSEFATLDPNYFVCNKSLTSDKSIEDYIHENEKLYMTSPSVWSSLGMKKYRLPDSRNRIITHGVDPEIFKFDVTSRNNIRSFYNVKDSDILLINIGAMTKNKGIVLILLCLNYLVNKMGKTHYKLLLKGTGDLYQTKQFLEIYFEELQRGNNLSKDEMNNLLTNHIIFTDKTLSYEKINGLFNAADLYISPYLAEGFNLTSLESLSAGLPVMISSTGSTREYIQDIYKNGGDKHIIYIESSVVEIGNQMKCNNINLDTVINTLLNNEEHIKYMKMLRNSGNIELYNTMRHFIVNNYSWNNVADLVLNYLKYIIEDSKNK